MLLYILEKLYNLDNKADHIEFTMNENEIYERIKQVLEDAPRNQYTAELHLQMLKYADELKNITAKEFCEGVGLSQSLGTEFSKMRNLTFRLKAAGLDTNRL